MMTFDDLEQLKIIQQFCVIFTNLTELPFHLVDRDSNLSPHFSSVADDQDEFCRLVQSLPAGRQRCRASARSAGIITEKSVKPYIYRCHAGLVDIVVPVIVRDNCIGHICSGKIRTEASSKATLKRLAAKWRAAGYDTRKMTKAYLKTRIIPKSKIEAAAGLLVFIANYILEMEEKITMLSDNLAKYDPIVKAKQYMRTHYKEKVTLTDVAQHVSLSSSRFDHVFKTGTGTTFVHYLQGLRLDHSKFLLSSTSLRISEIALDSGFFSFGHFNRSFKAREGLSPREYRRNAQLV